jgi:hypothetical protein
MRANNDRKDRPLGRWERAFRPSRNQSSRTEKKEPDSDAAQRNGERFAAGRRRDMTLKTLLKEPGSASLRATICGITTAEVCGDYSLSRPLAARAALLSLPDAIGA